ncbi:hypothetical protein, partial [Pseudacidovorax intermedius]|uniref:hypothetical protein n=1 Tax=Pseudacidovorax intermedius TaxID=433924 RepID=UPI0005BC724C
ARSVDVATGPGGQAMTLDMDGALGELTRVRGHLEVDLYGFFQVGGDFAIDRSSSQVTLADGSDVAVDLLTLGAHDAHAFAGLSGGRADDRTGLVPDGVDFALALITDKLDAERHWTSLQATAAQAEWVGTDGLTLAATGISVAINQASRDGDAVVDYGEGATALSIATGPTTELALALDGDQGELLQASGHLTVDMFGFFRVEGDFAIEKSSAEVTLAKAANQAEAEKVEVDLLTIGGTGVDAFAGINGGTSSAMGLELTGVEFGLALMSQQMAAGSTTPARTWTSLQATATSAEFKGVDGLELSAGAIAVAVNQAGKAGDQVVDYGTGKTELKVGTGTGSDLELTLDGSKGELLQASGHLTVDVFGFFRVEGDFAIEKSSAEVTLAKTKDQTEAEKVEVDLLTIGGSGIDAFAGVNGGKANAMGLALTDVEFGLALMSQQMAAGSTTPARTWTSLQASAASVAFVGLGDDVSASATDLTVRINRAGLQGDAVVDYADGATDLKIDVGTDAPLALDMAGSKGEMTQAAGHIALDIFGFFRVSGDFAVEKSTADVQLAAKGTAQPEKVAVDVLTIGGAGVDAFAGTGNAGLQLQDVDFGLALMTQQSVPGRTWTTLQATAGSASVQGLGNLQLDATDTRVLINQAGRAGDAVVDYASGATELAVATGDGDLAFDMAGNLGELLQVSSHLKLDVDGFFQVEGDFAIQTSTRTVTLADGTEQTPASQVKVDVLTIGGHDVDAFAGLHGGQTDALGLALHQVTFGLALMTEAAPAQGSAARTWTSLQATAGSAGMVGTGDLTLTASDVAVAINKAGTPDGAVVDYAAGATQLAVVTGSGTDLQLSMDGADGALLQASAHLVVDLYGFVQVEGDFAIETRTAEVRLQDLASTPDVDEGAQPVAVDLLAIGAHNVHAFAGVNGGTSDALGIELDGVDLAIALMTSQADPARRWTAVQASADQAAFIGIDAITLAATDVGIAINRASGAGQPVVDFARMAAPLTVNLGGGESLAFDLDGQAGNTTAVNIGRATLAISDYIYISGGFHLEQLATTHVDVVTGLAANGAGLSPALRAGLAKVQGLSADDRLIDDLEVSALLLSGTDLEIFAGLGPYFIDSNGNGIRDAGEAQNPDAFGVKLDDIDVGLVMFDSTLSADPDSVIPDLYALKVSWGQGIDIDLGGIFKFQTQGLTIDVNQGGAWAGKPTGSVAPYVDFASSFEGGLKVPTATGTPIVLDYDRATIAVSLAHALLNIGDFFQIEGSFAFERTTTQVDVATGLSAADSFGALGTDLARFKAAGLLSADNSRFTNLAVDSITIGAADVRITIGDPDDPFFTLDHIDVAFATFRASKSVDANGVIPLMYAMKASWANPLDVDWGFMQLQVQDLQVQLNQGSSWRGLTVSPTVDFVSSFGAQGMRVATGGDDVYLDFRQAYFGVEVGHALIAIGDFFYIEGGFSLGKGKGVAVDIVTGFGAYDPTAAAAVGTLAAPGHYDRIENYAMNMVTIGLSDVKLFVGAGPYFVDEDGDGVIDATRDPDAVGLVVDNLDLGMAIFTDPKHKVGRLWSLEASVDQIAFVGLDFLTLSAEGAEVHANQGTAWSGTKIRPYVDYLSSFGSDGLEVRTGGTPVALKFSTSYIGVDVARATLTLENFIHIQGGFSFEQGRRERFSVDTGATAGNLPLSAALLAAGAAGAQVSEDLGRIDNVEFQLMTIGLSDVDVFIGYGNPDFDSTVPLREQSDLFGLALSNVDLALAILTPTGAMAKLLPKFTALDGSADEFVVAGGEGLFELSSGRIEVQMNWSDGWKADPKVHASIDFSEATGRPLQVRAGDQLLTIDFAAGAFIQAQVQGALLSVSDFVYFRGDFAFRMGSATDLTVKTVLGATTVKANAIEFGANNVQAFVGINGPYRQDSNGDGVVDSRDPVNDEAIGLVIDDFDLGMTVLTTQFDALNPLVPANTKFVGLKGHGEQIGFVGFGSDFIQFNLQDIEVAVNASSRQDLVADFTNGGTREGLAIATGGEPVVLDFSNALIEATVAHATASVAGILSLQGGFTFQKRTVENVDFHLPGGKLTTSAEALVVAGKDIYAFAGINGPYRRDTNGDGVIDEQDPPNDDAIGLAIDDLDFALAMMTPTLAQGVPLPGKFFGLSATAGMAGIVGTDPFLTLNATDLLLSFNGAFLGTLPVPGAYVDFSAIDGGKGLQIPIGTQGEHLTLDFDSNSLGIGMQAHLGLFDLIDIDGGFHFEFELPDTSHLFPSIKLSGLGDLLPKFSPDLDFLKGALDFVRNIDLSIGFDPNLGLTLFGSLSLPDLSLDLGDFVHLRGDFQLNIGETFTGTLYTGLPSEVSLIETLLGDQAQSILGALKALGGVADDYSTIQDVSFKGLSFGASNVYAFVGLGNPDYEEVPGGNGKLQIANGDDLFGFSMEGLDVGLTMFKAQLPSVFKAQEFFSLYAHADSARTYGMGDVLKVRAEDLTIELNRGGEMFGGLLHGTADFVDSFPADAQAGRPAGFEVRTGGTPVYMQQRGTQLMGLDIGYAEIQVSQFLSLSGSLAFRKGERIVGAQVDLGGLQTLVNQATGNTGTHLAMDMETLTLGGYNLQGFAGVGGPYRYDSATDDNDRIDNDDPINDGAVGVAIGNVDFGLVIAKPALLTSIPGLEAAAPYFLTLKADVGYAGLVGVDPDILAVQAQDVSVNINTFVLTNDPTGNLNPLLQLFGPPSIDWAATYDKSPEDKNGNGVLDAGEDLDGNGKLATRGYALPAGGDHAVIIDFDQEIIQAAIGYAQINVAGFLQLSASMALTKKGSETVTLNNGQQTQVTSLAIGINDAYGFIGVGGYWRDSNGDGRIDENDTPNDSAVGLAVKNLDLGLVVAKELVIGLNSVDVGVYLAGRASVDYIGLVGVPGAEINAENMVIEINTGVRASVGLGHVVRDAASGAVSFDPDLSLSFSFTTIDFSKSTWLDSNGVSHQGYGIPTGNADEPVVLMYNEQLLRVFGEAQLKLFGLVSMTGVLDFRFSESEGLTAFADVTVSIGPEGLNLSRHGTGLVVVRGGSDPGVALRLALDADLAIGSV